MTGRDGRGRDEDVAKLYEEHPYPNHGVVSSVVARMLEPTVREVQAQRGRRRVRIVDVGCGTGEQTLGMARAFPEAEVSGVDFNAASVDRAGEFAAKYGLRVPFQTGDLLGTMPDLGDPDILVMIGVLGHLSDRVAALQRLAEVTRPGTMMLAMLYGSFGHAERLRVREALEILAGNASRETRLTLLREGGLAANTSLTHHLEMLSRMRRFGPDRSLIETVRRTISGRSSAYQADCYTHPQEATYTWAEAAELLHEGGWWEFVGWPRRSGMPDRPEQVAKGPAAERLNEMTRLDQASVYERLVAPFLLYTISRRSD